MWYAHYFVCILLYNYSILIHVVVWYIRCIYYVSLYVYICVCVHVRIFHRPYWITFLCSFLLIGLFCDRDYPQFGRSDEVSLLQVFRSSEIHTMALDLMNDSSLFLHRWLLLLASQPFLFPRLLLGTSSLSPDSSVFTFIMSLLARSLFYSCCVHCRDTSAEQICKCSTLLTDIWTPNSPDPIWTLC